MKKVLGYILAGLAGFAAGGACGWLVRKKTAEVAFEEISEEERAKQIAEDGDGIDRPADIQAAINRTFGLPDDYTDKEAADIPEELAPGLVQLDTQKMQYMSRWKAEEAADKYDTTTKKDPEHIIATDEDDDLEAGIDQEFMKEAAEEKQPQKLRSGIEEGTMEDWDHWLGIPDGDYDCVEIWWYDQDGVLTDDHDEEIRNPETYVGFDPEEQFAKISPDTTGDPDIRVIYNYNSDAIFQVVRKHASYARKKSVEEFGDDGGDDRSDWIRSRNM